MKEQALRLDRLRRPTAYAALVGLAISLTGCMGEDQPGDTTVPASQENPTVTPTPSEVSTDVTPTTATANDSRTQTSDKTSATATPPTETVVETPTKVTPTTTAPEETVEPIPTATPTPTERPTTAAPPPIETETSPPTEEPPTTTPPPETEPTPTDKDRVIDCMVERCIALTFDDGPSQYTDQLLGYLAEYDAKATFFVVGTQVQAHPDTAQRIVDEGHQIGNHTWNHDNLTMLSDEAIRSNLAQTDQLIQDTTGVYPEIVRPPGGAWNDRTVGAIDRAQILWDVDPRDWSYENRDSDYVADYITGHVSRGSIALMHDIRPTTVAAVPDILDYLTDEGYQLVTVDTLLGEDLSPGVYRRQDL